MKIVLFLATRKYELNISSREIYYFQSYSYAIVKVLASSAGVKNPKRIVNLTYS